MIKIYSSQEQLEAISNVDNIATTEFNWWIIYDANTLEIIISPQQCLGFTSSPYTMVIADTKEELNQYIQDNGLIFPLDPYDSFSIYNIE